jgi:septum formation protein
MIVLASASPRRKELLAQAGFEFQVAASGIPEIRKPSEAPIAFAIRLAREKAEDVASRTVSSLEEKFMFIGADTIVVCDDLVLGKPADAEDARRMLRVLAGRTHQVITGVCVLSEGVAETAAEVTFVTMHTIADAEIDAYVATGEPMDKAGAYAIQGYAARWIPRVHGCYFNVVGLPIALVSAMVEGAQRRAK